MKSVMSHQFSQVPKAEIQRSSFDRSHGYKTTFESGYLIPIFLDEALPGDTFNLKMTTFARLATPIVPFMDNMFCDSFFFAVPMRLVWDNWQKFNGEQTDPGDSTDYLIPQTSPKVGGYDNSTIYDYMGLPTQVANFTHSALWNRAYNLIWNEWFRDQNLEPSVPVPRGDGPDDSDDYFLLTRGKRHDYFTSALPWPQKGPAVTLPLGTSAPVYGQLLGQVGGSPSQISNFHLYQSATGGGGGVSTGRINNQSDDHLTSTGMASKYGVTLATPAQIATYNASNPTYPAAPPYADLSTATAATINALRQAFQIQRLYERDARGGTRYTEIIRAHFGVTSPDARLQRPEYLGGGSSSINVNPIAQTSASPASPSPTATPQGNLAAIGTMSSGGHGFTKSFTEHTLIIGMISVRADLNYQQGMNRMWNRRTRWDFYWPALAHLGEQTVLNKEIYTQGSLAVNPSTGIPYDEEAFGYQERFSEYRYKPSLITGQFRSNFAQSLDIWHLAQDFAMLPQLNEEFIREDPPVNRVIAVPSEPQFLFDAYFNLRCARPMPVYSVPGLIDHF